MKENMEFEHEVGILYRIDCVAFIYKGNTGVISDEDRSEIMWYVKKALGSAISYIADS